MSVQRVGSVCACLGLLAQVAFGEQSPVPSTMKLFIKGSAAYATPADVPVPTALLVATSKWDGLTGSTFSGTQVFVAELAVVLSNRAMDCETVFAEAPFTADPEFQIVAGRIEAFDQKADWQTTSFGKVLSDAATSTTQLPIDKFSMTVSNRALKKGLSKDKLQAPVGHLTLVREASNWIADLVFRSDQVSAEGKVPLKLCPAVVRQTAVLKVKDEDRKKAPDAPLLGIGRVMDAAVNYGKK